ncbi:MAG: hypothetical protein COU82_01905 [Candidatus Portnoybacteria bacterium CG10_big_fil_rev_8_21_14_0_10_38_18]|uniref:Uncharacterized protein n=1 Tax=Candidatus Portnoybacteria bacterium CG10_big_fil_rev_8_21_14_0_10_38_18 TaxID=1974813 RepID=A0A2M8KC01_9BACT|nr:MAG: hypothetical protein COU82_01905 [Candidatus Portnoybacteria bacterium CG10_big_fil_rev_8_21_14_0_10_38_18]
MPGRQNPGVVNNTNTNPIKDPREWLDVIRWIAIFLISVFIPIIGLIYFWVKFKPSFEIFITLSVLYLIVTLLLLKPFVFGNKVEITKK